MGDASEFARRLKSARLRKGLSQEQLGVLAGIDEFSASARMNQYERGKHTPDIKTATRIAAVLDIPVAYLFADDDAVARLLLAYFRISPDERRVIDQWARSVVPE